MPLTSEGFVASTGVFEGPYHLLLESVSRRKVDIFSIPLADVIHDFTEYSSQLTDDDLEAASDFLEVAAMLMDIKAKKLLGEEHEEVEEELSVESVTAETRLAECRLFQSVALWLGRAYQAEAGYFTRGTLVEPAFADLVPDFRVGARVEDLRLLFSRLWKRYNGRLIDSGHIANIRVSVETMLGALRERLSLSPKATFRELTGEFSEREEIIAAFLAVLQLLKDGAIKVNQAVTFGEIEITWLGG